MRVRLTDGTHEVEIKVEGYSRRRLDDIEAAALRILDALRGTPPPTTTPPAPFGFTRTTPGDPALDGVSLDSSTERAEPYDDGRGDEYDDDEDGHA
ncbi:hypothetical protein [Streptomyces sp. NPDC006527]|uniref:hypothetical protein n=1 Tax=Streptomyces sp. NPDC006527 TaxID=3364749 RepID=UPI0036C985B5